jgi:hypothetical protein
MRFGNWRGMRLALAAALGLGLALASSDRAYGQLHTIPRDVAAYDFTTGRQYKAPPVPYGHYAKDYIGDADKALGCVSCKLHALMGGGGAGHGLFHHGEGDGNCDSGGCGDKHGFGHGGGSSCGVAGCGGGNGCKHSGHAGAAGYACTEVQPSYQTAIQPSAQSICGQPGCTIKPRHSHLGHHASASGCGLCGGAGCDSCGHSGHGEGCSFCGGKGCGHCLGGSGSGHGSLLHGKLASLAAGLHKPKTRWFLGAGGPVPLTPGYVPYIVVTRSPRDFFAFAPMNPYDR